MAVRLVLRALVTSVLVAVLAVSVAACNRGDNEDAALSTTTTKAKTTTTTVAAGAATSTTSTTTVSATTTSSGTPTTTPPAGVNIPQFDVPSSLSCARGATFSVPATWTTTANVFAVDYTIDGQAPGAQAGLPTSGRGDLGPVACDGQPHEITFYAYADANSSTSVRRTVTGRPR